jgi:long-chain acyl-CoA synthetase
MHVRDEASVLAGAAGAAGAAGPDAVGGVVDLSAADDPGSAFAVAHRRGLRLVLRTSGTTDRPRRVVRTTASWACSFVAYSQFAEIDGTARLWVPGPRSSTMNLFALVHAHAVGATVVGSVDEATHACLTPTALARLVADGVSRAGLRVVVAGDRLPTPLRERAVALGLRIRHYYGASELSFVACGEGIESLRPFPGAEIEIRSGVIWVRSPYLATGYNGGEGPLVVGPDGFATVGDTGALRDGVLVLAGRPDVVVTGGATVLLQDVEGVLQDVAASGVAVVGVPHDYLGSVIACVVEDPNDLPALRRAAAGRLSAAQRPRLWCGLASLPVSVAGKLDRSELRRLVVGARAGDGPVRLLVRPARG